MLRSSGHQMYRISSLFPRVGHVDLVMPRCPLARRVYFVPLPCVPMVSMAMITRIYRRIVVHGEN